MSEFSGSGDLENNLILGTIWTGIGTLAEVAKAGYGYVTDPQNRENTARNASQFARNFGKYTPNGREWFFNDPALGFSKYRQNAETQRQQLLDARYQRSQGIETGFDDEEDNVREDVIRDREEKSQRSNKYRRSDENSYDNSQGGFAPDTVVSSALRTYKQIKQQANYADNSYTPFAYTSYADLRRSLPDYQAPQYQGYQAPDISSFSDELDRQQQASEARSQQAASYRELKQREWAAKYPEIDAMAKQAELDFNNFQNSQPTRLSSYSDLRASLYNR